MTGKQREKLRAMANGLDTILYIGKDGVTDATLKEAYDALEAREIVKCAVQQGSGLSAREACGLLCEKTNAEPVAVIGRRFVIYRQSNAGKHIL